MKKLFFILLLPLILGSQCNKEDECHKKIIFENKENFALYVIADWDYPDTLSFIHSGGFIKDYRVDANSTNDKVLELRDCHEARLNVSNYGIITIYVFNADTVDNNDWSYIYENYKVLKRYELTLQDLQNSNWTITFP